jgi:hypothetical protein
MPSLAVSAVLTLTVLAAEPSQEAPPEQLRIAAPGLTGVGIPETAAAFYTEHLAQQLSFAGARVVTQKELQALLGLNRQQQLVGCTEGDSGCVLELSKVMAVDLLLLGDVARLEDDRFQVSLKLLSAKGAAMVAAHSARVDGQEALLDELSSAARRMAPEAAAKLGRRLDPSLGQEARRGTVRAWSWLPTSVGAASAVFGAFAYNRAAQRHDALTGTQGLSPQRAAELRDSGKAWQTVSRVGLGLGAAGLLTGATMYLLGGSSAPVTPVATMGNKHFTVGITGVLP